MLILKTEPELLDFVRLPSGKIGQITTINANEQTFDVRSEGDYLSFSWADDLELIAFSPTRTIICQADKLSVEMFRRTAAMDCLEHEARRKLAEALFT